MQQPVEHRRGQRLVVCKCTCPLRERRVAREDQRAALVALDHDAEEQVRLMPREGQVADLVDHGQLRPGHRSVEVFLHPKLQDLRDVAQWAKGMVVGAAPKQHGTTAGTVKAQID